MFYTAVHSYSYSSETVTGVSCVDWCQACVIDVTGAVVVEVGKGLVMTLIMISDWVGLLHGWTVVRP